MIYEYFEFQDGVQKYDFNYLLMLTEYISYVLLINGKYIKFGARFRFDILIQNNHHSYYIFRSGGTICNPSWLT